MLKVLLIHWCALEKRDQFIHKVVYIPKSITYLNLAHVSDEPILRPKPGQETVMNHPVYLRQTCGSVFPSVMTAWIMLFLFRYFKASRLCFLQWRKRQKSPYPNDPSQHYYK